MRRPRCSGMREATWLSVVLLPALVTGYSMRCNQIVADSISFDLSALGGPHSVMVSSNSTELPGTFINTTYTLDLCGPLKRSDHPKEGQGCPGGTRVCAITHLIDPVQGTDTVHEVVPIAGNLKDYKGGSLDPAYTRLSTGTDQEGVKIELSGGYSGATKRKQKAIIELLCDVNRTGLEGELANPDDKYEKGPEEDEEADKATVMEDAPTQGEVTEPSLTFVKHDKNKADTDEDIVLLRWRTKYACEKSQEGGGGRPTKGGWGFFTWVLIIAFLGIAAYLIFGSWLNYTRYGARGWDLLPHGDTIRDIPYLVKDWSRRVVNTVQGGGSRGGYSAV